MLTVNQTILGWKIMVQPCSTLERVRVQPATVRDVTKRSKIRGLYILYIVTCLGVANSQ